jgi:DNA-binding transcriptional MerR regulator
VRASAPTLILSASEAARRLGVSAKALRLYERRGLLAPIRTAAGWRAYGPDALARGAEIVALRALGLGLAEVARVLASDGESLEPALAKHQAVLHDRLREIAGAMTRVRKLRAALAGGQMPAGGDPSRRIKAPAVVGFDLPWPWGGERFELRDVRPLTYIIGPLGSGKTRLARRLAETLPDAGFLGLDRLADGGAAARARLDADPGLAWRVDRALTRLVADGAAPSEALVALLAGLEAGAPAILVVDMVEEGLDKPAQEALAAHLRRRGASGRPLVMLTRSSSILNLAAVGDDEAIILCPANHSPAVRARTAGVIAWRPAVA